MKKSIGIALTLIALSIVAIVWGEQPKAVNKKVAIGNVFYVYDDAGSRANHYCPAGWMGDYNDIKYAQNYSTGCAKGKSCIRVQYSAERKNNAGWAGIYWQMPCGNWGDKKGGYDLTGFTKLKFSAKSDNAAYLDKFMMGGIQGQIEEGDTDSSETDAMELTKNWKEYEIDLKGLDLSNIIGGFGFAINAELNPQGTVFFLDEIRYEK